ncbi:ATP-binding protein [Streptomyces sp. SudanB25_2051]|uniref:ATP-binding protein n=1 Tax=Streptomyces sp. SudanB25_2051 TaxID=3035275 RepID=UPI003F57D15F
MTAAEHTADRPQTAVAAARARVRRLLGTREDDAVPAGVADDILLVVTELVTNAARHGGGVTGFHAELDGDDLVVSVADASPALPHTRPRDDPAASGGFGWPLVLRLSSRVTVAPAPGGKTVTAVLPLRGTPGEPESHPPPPGRTEAGDGGGLDLVFPHHENEIAPS